MTQQQEQFINDYIESNGFFCIIDALEAEFKISKVEASKLFDLYKNKYSESESVKSAQANIESLAANLEEQINNFCDIFEKE